jgi:hypothetical protein
MNYKCNFIDLKKKLFSETFPFILKQEGRSQNFYIINFFFKKPEASKLQREWDNNMDSLLTFLESARHFRFISFIFRSTDTSGSYWHFPVVFFRFSGPFLPFWLCLGTSDSS